MPKDMGEEQEVMDSGQALCGGRPVGVPVIGLLRTMQLATGHANASRRFWRRMGSKSLEAAGEWFRVGQRYGIFLTESDFNYPQPN